MNNIQPSSTPSVPFPRKNTLAGCFRVTPRGWSCTLSPTLFTGVNPGCGMKVVESHTVKTTSRDSLTAPGGNSTPTCEFSNINPP
eukprot:3829318-Rhodomonas_salina.1